MNKTLMRSHAIFFLIIVSILAFSFYLQTLLYANHDAVWLLHCTRLMLGGGKYYFDFFETNPPLILLFYTPAIALANLFQLSDYSSLLIYFYSWIIFIIVFCYFLLKQIFDTTTNVIGAILITLTIFITILSYFWFIDRETCTVILVLPYLFLMCQRLTAKNPSFLSSLLTGILAAIGFSLKPYFLYPLVFVELYYLFYRRSIFAVLKTESIVIFFLMVCYLGSIILFFPDYFHHILPITFKLYIPAFAKTPFLARIDFIFLPIILLGIVVAFIYLFSLKQKKNTVSYFAITQAIVVVFSLATVGFILAYIQQGRNWFYHIFPAIVTITVPLTLLIASTFTDICLLKKSKDFSWRQAAISLFAILILAELALQCFKWNDAYFLIKKTPDTPETSLLLYLKPRIDHQSILILSNSFLQETIRHDTDAQLIGRFPSMLLIPGIKQLQLEGKHQEYLAMRQLFFSMMMTDIQKNPPTYIVFERIGYWFYIGSVIHTYSLRAFFLDDPLFKQYLQQYHLIATLPYFEIYQKT